MYRLTLELQCDDLYHLQFNLFYFFKFIKSIHFAIGTKVSSVLPSVYRSLTNDQQRLHFLLQIKRWQFHQSNYEIQKCSIWWILLPWIFYNHSEWNLFGIVYGNWYKSLRLWMNDAVKSQNEKSITMCIWHIPWPTNPGQITRHHRRTWRARDQKTSSQWKRFTCGYIAAMGFCKNTENNELIIFSRVRKCHTPKLWIVNKYKLLLLLLICQCLTWRHATHFHSEQ